MLQYWPIIIAAAGFLLTASGMLATVTWRLSQIETRLRAFINSTHSSFDDKLADITRQVNAVELFAAQHYVTMTTLEQSRNSIIADIKDLANALQNRLERMENKIDTKPGR